MKGPVRDESTAEAVLELMRSVQAHASEPDEQQRLASAVDLVARLTEAFQPDDVLIEELRRAVHDLS